jgi:hypothetical protein
MFTYPDCFYLHLSVASLPDSEVDLVAWLLDTEQAGNPWEIHRDPGICWRDFYFFMGFLRESKKIGI